MAATGFRSRFRALMPWTNGDTPPASANGRETRSTSTGYTDLALAGLFSRAAGDRTTDPASLAAIESAAGIWSRAMMSARVEGDARVQGAVTPRFLKLVSRQWIRTGESVHLISVNDAGRVALLPVATFDVDGGPVEESYRYRCDLYGPSRIEYVNVDADGIVHSRWATHPTQPWRGVPPWRFANLSAGLLAALERSLAWEAATPVGQLFPQPDVAGDEDPEDDDVTAQLRATLANLEGAAALVPTTAGGGGLGPQEAPRQDWKGIRAGADPPQSLIGLREQVELSIFGACGIPAALAVGRNDGTLARESWRRFVVGAVEPMANELAGVLSEALETPVSFNFRSLWAHDLVGRVTAYDKLTKAGMPPAQARIISGLSEVD